MIRSANDIEIKRLFNSPDQPRPFDQPDVADFIF